MLSLSTILVATTAAYKLHVYYSLYRTSRDVKVARDAAYDQEFKSAYQE